MINYIFEVFFIVFMSLMTYGLFDNFFELSNLPENS